MKETAELVFIMEDFSAFEVPIDLVTAEPVWSFEK